MARRSMARIGRVPMAVATALVLVLALFATTAAEAAEELGAGGKFRTGDSVEVAQGETFDGNLYAFAGTIDIKGTLDGDLVASGGTISIDGTVTGDVTVAGGQLTVDGEVEGDVRFAGGELQLDGTVDGDVAMVGGRADVAGDVGSDVLFGTGEMTIGGDVAGQVYGAAGDYVRTGTVAGLEDVTQAENEAPSFGDRVVAGLLRFVTLFLVGALLLVVLRRPLEAVLTRARQRPAASLLAGLIVLASLVAFLVVSILVGIVWSILFGLLRLGLLVATYWFAFGVFWVAAAFALFLLAVYAAPIVTGLFGARLAMPGQHNIWVQLAALAVGLAVYLIVTAIPVVGWILAALALLFAAGAIVLTVRNFGARTPEPVTAEA